MPQIALWTGSGGALPKRRESSIKVVEHRPISARVEALYSIHQVIRALLDAGRPTRCRSVGGVEPRALPITVQPKRGDGMSLIDLSGERQVNPVDVVERLASVHDWSFDRAADDEITISIAGRWSDYHVSFTWMHEIEALHLACAFDLKVPDRRAVEVRQLLSHINQQLWVGHFDLWPGESLVMFRHALVLAGGVEASGQQCEAVLEAALEACERYFQAFQFVVWAGKGAREAMDSAMFDTSGEA